MMMMIIIIIIIIIIMIVITIIIKTLRTNSTKFCSSIYLYYARKNDLLIKTAAAW